MSNNLIIEDAALAAVVNNMGIEGVLLVKDARMNENGRFIFMVENDKFTFEASFENIDPSAATELHAFVYLDAKSVVKLSENSYGEFMANKNKPLNVTTPLEYRATC